MNDLELRLFQAAHDDHFGDPLSIDGDLGSWTRWALGINSLCPKRRLAIYRCQRLMRRKISEVGGDNRHPFIDVVLERCLVARGNPWCAAAASFVLDCQPHAGAQDLGKSFPMTLNPCPGDLGWYPTGRWTGHVFVIGAYDPTAQQVMTYEGNQNNAFRCIRRPCSGLHFSRTFDDDSNVSVLIPKDSRISLAYSTALMGTR
jgi:hypothetical protein